MTGIGMVDWTDGAIENPQPASDEAVRAVEKELGVKLPVDFLVVAQTHQGASPEPASLDLPDDFVTSVDYLLHFEDEPFSGNILAARFPYEDVLEPELIPFAIDIGGDPYCFDYSENPESPGVVFWSVDWGAIPLAKSFTDFVALLHD